MNNKQWADLETETDFWDILCAAEKEQARGDEDMYMYHVNNSTDQAWGSAFGKFDSQKVKYLYFKVRSAMYVK